MNKDLFELPIKSLRDSIDSLSLANIEQISTIMTVYANMLTSINEPYLKNVQKSFEVLNDHLQQQISHMNFMQQNAFMAGQLHAINQLNEKLIQSFEQNRELAFLEQSEDTLMIINEFAKKNSMTHKELSAALDISPQNLSMKFKRHPEINSYINVVQNPYKRNSILYYLNAEGKSLIIQQQENLIMKDISAYEIPSKFEKYNRYYQGGNEYERDYRDIRMLVSKQ